MGSSQSSAMASVAEQTGLLAVKSETSHSANGGHGAHGDVTRRVSAMSVAFLTFSCVAGGPFGIEVAVNAAGGFYTIIGLLMAALLWGFPQALMTAELGSSIPANGGPVVWVRRALGPNFAFVNGLLLVINQACDVVLYPTLVASYIQQVDPINITDGRAYAIKVVCTLVCVGVNIVGIEAVSQATALLSLGIMIPFGLIPIAAAAKGRTFDWKATGPAGAPDPQYTKDNLAVFVSTLLWCMQGWSEIGMLAGEIDDAGRVLPRGMSIAAVLIMAAYSCPVLFGVALQPNLDLWEDGFLVTLGQNIAPWLGGFMIAGAALANMNTFITSMAAYSRTLQAVVTENIIPIPALGKNMTKYKTPVPCILFLGATTLALSYGLDFETLVVADSVFYLLANILIAVAFVRLKYTEPDLVRPFTFPGGNLGAWIATISIIVLGIFTLYADSEGADAQLYAALGSVVAMALVSILWKSRCAPRNYDDKDAAEIEDPQFAKPVPGEPDKVELTRWSSKGHIVAHRTIDRTGSIARNLSRGASLVLTARAGSVSREGGMMGGPGVGGGGGRSLSAAPVTGSYRSGKAAADAYGLNEDDDEEEEGSKGGSGGLMLSNETSVIPPDMIRKALHG